MIDLLTSIIETIVSLVQFVINAINGLIQLFLLIPQAISFITSSIAMLPPFVVPFIMAGLYIGIVQYIVGKQE